MFFQTIIIASAAACVVSATDILSRCAEHNIKFPYIPGTQLLEISAQPVENYTTSGSLTQSDAVFKTTLDICNVTINYAHQGWEDNVKITIWLPLRDWNGRLSGIGGAGFSSLASFSRFAPAVSRGYAAVGTDAGHVMDSLNASSWALDESSRVNFFLLQNNFAISQNEAAIVAKEVIRSVYRKGPQYSYWDGCSTGGRQGLMLAQRYPDAYDGILVGAPAINWANFVPGMYYPQFVMNRLNHFPRQCIFSAIVNATIAACDELDGVKDGILSMPFQCHFDPSRMVHQKVDCGGEDIAVTKEDVQVMQAIWDGPKGADGSPLWYGMPKGVSPKDQANTTCQGDRCTGVPFNIAADWIKLFVLQDETVDLATLPETGFEAVTDLSVSAYKYVTSTDNPDLQAFRETGGKILHWHGLADQQIYVQGSQNYYERVEAKDVQVRDFYRFFEAPGVAHCGGGYGLLPVDPFSVLVDWVESGVAPDHLPAATEDGSQQRNLCPYPLVPSYTSGNPTRASSFKCRALYA
ncbi:Tannase/feruloyl esterase [Aspergillus pseudoustus]|uniref:Carboxylic ester hydrolase n=1 Tax=Aspergillus pseudoustus TaxID=1810923 RepID=A0ABR4K6U6_9EURO